MPAYSSVSQRGVGGKRGERRRGREKASGSEVSDLLTTAGNLNPRSVKMERLHAFVRAIIEAWCVLARARVCAGVCALQLVSCQKGAMAKECARALIGVRAGVCAL